MSIWVDRQNGVAGPGVRALIIGISDYEFLPNEGAFPDQNRETLGLTKVDIPATGAFLVAKWLRDKYWHPTHKVKTIRLLVSPSKLELEPPKPADSALDAQDRAELKAVAGAAPPVTDNVRDALLEWQAECDSHPEDMAVLYISGHGTQWDDKDDAIVLLRDFSRNKLFLDQSVSIRRVVKGMSGSKMPQVQLYFVDCCRIHPDEYKKFDFAGSPIGLPSKFTAADLRSAPIYFAACPQTYAKGRPGRGTYFAEALLDCLNSAGLQGPVFGSALPVATTHWHVNVANLAAALQDRITIVAARDGEKQDIVPGGALRPAVFCASPTPPPVTLVIDVDPDDAAKVAFADLWNHNRSVQIATKVACWERPLILPPVAPGLYLLELSATPPFKTPYITALDAQPPRWPLAPEPIRLS